MRTRKLLDGLLPGIALAALLTGGWGCSDSAVQPAPTTPPGIEEGLAAALQGWADDFGLYGAAMRVYSPDGLDWSGATGQYDAEAGVPYRTDSLGRVASSTKPFTGHTLGAAGAVEAAICWMMLAGSSRTLLPAHLWDGVVDDTIPGLRLAGPEDSFAEPPRYVLSNSFAFGGNNISLILGNSG